jgi:N6-L-threonylcarbamoyladenine synthase
MPMRILGIETSADETGVALIEASGTGEKDFHYKMLGNALLSQADLHMRYGGIFPNLAKREHGRNLVPVLMECIAPGRRIT